MTQQVKLLRASGAVVLFLGLAGCDNAFGTADDAALSLSFSTPTSARLSTSISPSVEPITGGGHTLDLQNVDLSFSEVLLERAEGGFGGDSDGDSDTDSDSDGPANERFRSGPVTVALPLQGGVITPLSTSIPAGFYEELEMDLSTVRLRGTFDGESFDVTVPVDSELEMDFEPPLEVTSTSDPFNITVAIDAQKWLRNADGTLVDPRLLASNADLRETILERIENSFDAFEDSDRDSDDEDSDSDSDSD